MKESIRKMLTISGVIALLLLVYAVLQSLMAELCMMGALYLGKQQGVVHGNIMDIMYVPNVEVLPSVVQRCYYAGMSVGLFLSAVLMLLVIHKSGLFRMRTSLFRSIQPRPLLLSTALVFTSMWVMNIFVQWLPLDDLMQDRFAGISRDPLGALTISVIAPVLEEVMFRGAIQGYLIRRTGKPVASIVAAALVFGIFHMNPIQVVFATMFGIVLGWIYYRTGSLMSVIVGHVLNNSIATLTMLTMSHIDEKAVSNESPAYFVFVLFLILSIVLVRKLNSSLPPVPVPWRESDEPEEAVTEAVEEGDTVE